MQEALIKSIVNEYQLQIDGVSFWAPYWRDEIPKTEDDRPLRGPLNGKGTPAQLTDYLKRHLHNSPTPLKSGEDYRQFMHHLGLGVDCSGFVFYVLDQCLHKTKGKRLQDHLFKSRDALLADFHNPAYVHPKHITEELLKGQPEQVSLTKIQEFWGNQPVRLAGVRILISEAANVIIPTAAEIQIGDQILMEGRTGTIPHHVLVVAVADDVITYAHSGRLDNRADGELGGVEYDRITITDPSKPINHQVWDNQALIDEHVLHDDCTRRLKVLVSG